ncbi:nicotinamide-nucleotide adenylyltransferase [Staphylothermus hellenicus]|uniref:Nicotinamide-nucleotide adenylyltransferase n=1 Tax=Staphylothermus hellenicus (strain DSM 12710 / JCM 10830 / BK20S6-10-b1 / P8) TaxID=591019 RepID=D7DA21_STAHD|nr:nicotinamide-nucleotide adenylyltransferase [Staphylothermus hellenicus]ADI32617.1 nicotinamide-nucleotide adenylyltransferase [Staphylothermus hellenicus DSM 12710]
MRRVLYPGRFQPFHKGHLRVVEKLLREFDEVVIVIGSAQEGFTCNNPFTASERIEMIDYVLRSNGMSRDKYWLIPIPDIRMPLAWTTYVLSMVPRVDAVASGNPHVVRIYDWIGFKTIKLNLFNPSEYNGTVIRRRICNGLEWKHLVPEQVAQYIESINGVERIREVCGCGDHRD